MGRLDSRTAFGFESSGFAEFHYLGDAGSHLVIGQLWCDGMVDLLVEVPE